MRIAIVSDVHGNLRALEAVRRAVERDAPDLVLHGGDLAMTGQYPAEVVDTVRALGWEGVAGNWDAALGAGVEALPAQAQVMAPALEWALERLAPERVSWLQRLPHEHTVDGLLLLHASPGDLWQAPNPDAPDDVLDRTYGNLQAETVVYCHIHQPFVRRVSVCVANSGSVGWPLDGDWRPSYLLIDDGWVTVRRVEYDRDSAVADLERSGYPLRSWLGQVYRDAHFVLPIVPDD